MTSFAPLLEPKSERLPHTLILGSMPSRISLGKNQYYANPNNTFWWIVGQIYGFSDCLAYSNRVNSLTAAGVAVWDVLLDCRRAGSMDKNIEQASEQPNDIFSLIESVPSIGLIAFNGAAAKQIFMRHCASVLQSNAELRWVLLPSTSPAHAAMSRPQKLQAWRAALSNADDLANMINLGKSQF